MLQFVSTINVNNKKLYLFLLQVVIVVVVVVVVIIIYAINEMALPKCEMDTNYAFKILLHIIIYVKFAKRGVI